MRTDRNVHLLAIGRKRDVAGPVSPTAQVSAARQVGNLLSGSPYLYIAIVIWKAHHGIRVSHIDPLRSRTWWIERNAKWLVQPTRKNLAECCLTAFIDASKNLDLALVALCQKNVAVRRGPQQPWIVQTSCV